MRVRQQIRAALRITDRFSGSQACGPRTASERNVGDNRERIGAHIRNAPCRALDVKSPLVLLQ